jgi:hypothetical protein
MVLIGGKKRATNWMNLSQLRRAVWLRRLSDASQSRFTLLKNHHRLGWCCARAAMGHAAAPLPMSVMNSRRRILTAETTSCAMLKA